MTTNVTSPVLYALGTLTTVFLASAGWAGDPVRHDHAAAPCPAGVGRRQGNGLMRLVVINPNSTVSMTDKAAAAARAAAPGVDGHRA